MKYFSLLLLPLELWTVLSYLKFVLCLKLNHCKFTALRQTKCVFLAFNFSVILYNFMLIRAICIEESTIDVENTQVQFYQPL